MSQVSKAMHDQQNAMIWALLAARMTMRKALLTGTKPDFRQLKRALAYIERFAEGQHQANEERYLFRPVQAREPNLARTLARLRRDHVAMKGYRIRLSEALSYWHKGDPKAGPQAAIVAEDYLRFCQRHVRAEREVLPALQRVLSETEWTEVGRALGSVADPLATSGSRQERMAALQTLE